jgi:hypothetical protein
MVVRVAGVRRPGRERHDSDRHQDNHAKLAAVSPVHARRDERTVRGQIILENAGGCRDEYRPHPRLCAASGFVLATEKYGGQAQAVVLPDGRHDIRNYVAGMPFPNPSEPNKGWKILADDWLPPAAWIYAGTPDTGLLTGAGRTSCTILVARNWPSCTDSLGSLLIPAIRKARERATCT